MRAVRSAGLEASAIVNSMSSGRTMYSQRSWSQRSPGGVASTVPRDRASLWVRKSASPMNRATNRLDRLVEDGVGEVQLDDATAAHHRDAVADGERFLLIVGDEQGGGAGRTEDVDDLIADPCPQVGVEAGERFVEQQERRLEGEGTSEGDALPFAAGEFVRVALVVAGEADELQHLGGASGPGLRVPDAESDVAGHGEVREQGVILEDETDPSLLGWQRASPVVDDVAGEFDAPVRRRDGFRRALGAGSTCHSRSDRPGRAVHVRRVRTRRRRRRRSNRSAC